MELELDFGEEDVEFADRGGYRRHVTSLLARIDELVRGFSTGRAIAEGVPVAILGFVLVPGGLERSLGCDLELALRLGMAREMIGERRDGLGVKVERMQFLRNDAVD